MKSFFAQAGDTIIEVLLAVTVICLFFGGSAVLASRNARSLQATQERSAGLKLAQTQLEYIKQFAASPTNYEQLARWVGGANTFCFTQTLEIRSGSDSACSGIDSSGATALDGTAAYSTAILLTPEFDGYNVKVSIRL